MEIINNGSTYPLLIIYEQKRKSDLGAMAKEVNHKSTLVPEKCKINEGDTKEID